MGPRKFSRRVRIFILGMAVLLLTPLGAWASHGFVDVPTDNPYHADINWVVENGISDGCEETDEGLMFCPEDPLTREHAARWFHRFAESDLGVGIEGPAGEDGAQGPAGPAGPVGPRGPSDAFYYSGPTEDVGSQQSIDEGHVITIKLPDFGSYVVDTAVFIGNPEYGSNVSLGPSWCQYVFSSQLEEVGGAPYFEGVPGGLDPVAYVALGEDYGNASWSQVVTARDGKTGLQLQLHCSPWLTIGQVLITGIRVADASPVPFTVPSASPSPVADES